MTEDLSTFRFPTRPVRVLAEDPPALEPRESEDEDGDGDGRGVLALAPPWQDPAAPVVEDLDTGTWTYDRRHRTLFNRRRNKKIALRHLNNANQITRLIAALEHLPDMEVEGLMAALNEACQDCYQETLLSVLSAYSGGGMLEWPADDPATRSSPARRGF